MFVVYLEGIWVDMCFILLNYRKNVVYSFNLKNLGVFNLKMVD